MKRYILKLTANVTTNIQMKRGGRLSLMALRPMVRLGVVDLYMTYRPRATPDAGMTRIRAVRVALLMKATKQISEIHVMAMTNA